MQTNDPGKFNFISKANLFGGISFLLVVASLAIILVKNFNYGIDFSGGTEVQVQFETPVNIAELRKVTADLGHKNASVQSFGEENEFLVRFGSVVGSTDKETNELLSQIIANVTGGFEKAFVDEGIVIRRVDSVGPQIGEELKTNGLLAIFYALIMILIYVGLRFDYKYAPGAVICLFHDAVITLGIFALLQREVNVQTMAAILTIIGYSLNDTIVTFDRIRENVKIYKGESFKWIVNRSLNDVLSRTLLTSITTLIAVVAMYLLAGGVIKDFAFTLGIGVIVGTYSSIYIASPLVIVADKLQNNA